MKICKGKKIILMNIFVSIGFAMMNASNRKKEANEPRAVTIMLR